MPLVVTLAKVAVGFARSRGLFAGSDGEGPELDAEQARAMLDRAKEGRDKARQLVDDIQDGKGRERVRDLVVRAAQKRGLSQGRGDTDISAAKTEPAETSASSDAVTVETATANEAELGLDVMMTALSGAAVESGQSIDDLLDGYNAEEPVAEVDQAAVLMLRAMLMAAKADGEIDADEKAAILSALGPDTDEEDRAMVQRELVAPLDVAALAQATGAGQAVQVYSSALMAIRVDTPPEAIFLDRLARGLGLSEQVVNALHIQMGRARLYRKDG